MEPSVTRANRSNLVFEVVCIATMPGLTLLVGAIGLALLQITSREQTGGRR